MSRIARHFGMEESLEDLITARRLCAARMNEHKIPKRLLFGWFPQHMPAHGVKMRWREGQGRI